MRIVWMIMKDAKSIIKNIVGQSIWCRLSNMPHGCIGIIWFAFLDFGWEIDIAYNNIVEDVETDRIFFVINQHPLENGLSRFVSKKTNRED